MKNCVFCDFLEGKMRYDVVRAKTAISTLLVCNKQTKVGVGGGGY